MGAEELWEPVSSTFVLIPNHTNPTAPPLHIPRHFMAPTQPNPTAPNDMTPQTTPITTDPLPPHPVTTTRYIPNHTKPTSSHPTTFYITNPTIHLPPHTQNPPTPLHPTPPNTKRPHPMDIYMLGKANNKWPTSDVKVLHVLVSRCSYANELNLHRLAETWKRTAKMSLCRKKTPTDVRKTGRGLSILVGRPDSKQAVWPWGAKCPRYSEHPFCACLPETAQVLENNLWGWGERDPDPSLPSSVSAAANLG